MEEDGDLSADELWAEIERCGVEVTGTFTADNKSRICKKDDGGLFVVAVYESYPRYILDKVLTENGIGTIPLYNSVI